jgi:small subunit ribosomal protein S4
MKRGKKSEYGIRLEEKQKLRYLYGVTEKQFRRYFTEAQKDPQNTGMVLMQLLERRLDNVIYRLGFAKTRPAARQLVAHGHVRVNENKTNIPSFSVKVGDVITLKVKSLELPAVKEMIGETKIENIVKWLERKGPISAVKSMPSQDDIQEAIDLSLIIEYYSR